MNANQMTGKVCVVTGASSGIGKATAVGLAAAGAIVVMVCRDENRGKSARALAASVSGNESVDLVLGDLSSLASVRKLSADFDAKYPKLDVLINNAAVFSSKRAVTSDGFELMFATNYLGPFLLTRLLLPKLLAGRPSRIINLTAPATTMPEFDDLQGERKFGSLAAFGCSKAADLLFTYALARRLKERSVTVNAYHPGLVRTNLMRTASAPVRLMTGLMSLFMGVSPERASEGLVRLASGAQFESVTGMLIQDRKTIKAPFGDDLDAQERMWRVTCGLVGISEDI